MQKKPNTKKKYKALERKSSEEHNFRLLRAVMTWDAGSKIRLSSPKNLSSLGDCFSSVSISDRGLIAGNVCQHTGRTVTVDWCGFFYPKSGGYLPRGCFRYLRS